VAGPSSGNRPSPNRDTHACSIDWGDGSTTTAAVVEKSGKGTCTGSHAYAAAGNRTIRVTVRDDEGAEASASVGITATPAF
jgi:hypothetical protein